MDIDQLPHLETFAKAAELTTDPIPYGLLLPQSVLKKLSRALTQIESAREVFACFGKRAETSYIGWRTFAIQRVWL